MHINVNKTDNDNNDNNYSTTTTTTNNNNNKDIYCRSGECFSHMLIGQFGSEQQVVFTSELLIRQSHAQKVLFLTIFRHKKSKLIFQYISVVYFKTIIHVSVGESGGDLHYGFAAQ